ncbi:MAG TPA: Ig-like domain-containing protein, partial [Pirellulaceae bacterium]|nr:Ig-like domain-containing protein [Pirellulaceae bacterium]
VTVKRTNVGIIGTTIADGSGAWSFDYTGVALPEGVHRFTAISTDVSNNVSDESLPFVVTVDSSATAPVFTAITTDTGASDGDQVTSDRTLVLSGDAEPNAEVEVRRTGVGVLGTIFADSAGRWSYDYTSTSLAAGIHQFTAESTDVAGNLSATSSTFSVTVDFSIAAPSISGITADTGPSGSDGVTSDRTLLISGIAEPNSSVDVTRAGAGVIGTAVADSGGVWAYDYTATSLAEGTHQFTAKATDLAGNVSSASATFLVVVDVTAPSTASFGRRTPVAAFTNSDTLVFRATFSEPVAGVDANDFTVNGTTAVLSVTVVSQTQYDITLSGGNLAALDGVVDLNFASGVSIIDLAGNPLPSAEPPTDESYTVDNTSPATTSFTRQFPIAANTNADTLVFRATFNEPVSGVDASDFSLSGTTATLSVNVTSSTQYDITVTGGNLATLNAIVGLNFSTGASITDLAGNALPRTEPATDESFTVDNTAPVASSFVRQNPTASPTSADTLVFRVTFNEAMSGVDATDFVAAGTSAALTVAPVSGSQYDVTLAGGNLAGLNGTVGLNFAPSAALSDLAGNPLPAGEPATDETYIVDNGAPATSSFARRTPASSFANADTLVFRATFTEAVTGVDANDFTVWGTTAALSVSVVSGAQYDITVSGGNLAALNGVVGLDFAASVSIADLAGNPLPNAEPTTDETFTVDNTAPSTVSFTRQFPTAGNTNSDTLVFRATFNEAVNGVDASDFSLSGTTASLSVSASSSTQFDITVTGGNLANLNASVGLNFSAGANIADLAGNALPRTEPATDETYVVDNTAPAASSFVRQSPASTPTNADSLVFRVTFNEAVTGVDASDFAASGTTASLAVAAVSGTQYDVTLAGGNLASLDGTVGLNFAPSMAITDLAGNVLPAGEPPTDQTYVVDNTAPTTTSFARRTPASTSTNADTLVFRVTFSEAVTGVDVADFAVAGTTASASVATVSGTQYDVTVAGGNLASLNGVVGLNFAAAATITDSAGNALPSTEPATDETFTVDNAAPSTMSFARHTPTTSPTNADSLVFRVTFDEAVSGVDAGDFALAGTT